MAVENTPMTDKMKPTNVDIPVTDVNKMTDEQLTQAVLNAGSSTEKGEQCGTK